MNLTEIRSKKLSEIKDEIEGSNRELLNLRFQWQAGEVINSAQYCKTRKSIARLKTIQREMEIGLNKHLCTNS